MDITSYPWVYVPFAIVLSWWLISKGIRKRKDKKTEENNTKILERAANVLERIEKRFDDYDKQSKNKPKVEIIGNIYENPELLK